ncbi:hypothetical protein NO263_08960 [Gluconacetobacter entanii]|uniref:Uncharacterized protein n=1 Tax=Gluconacetobacter entanii TaxID=108528 RepID=A0ABT3K5P5_9PROT|nr:hypothetical protein [Gluconacetobacter entanii]MCW4590709.1 hypothetical protein [Gluconacetobacter entanii]MCW4592672.1 hypothetical protein [Gluconacetobacter entanii]
MTTGGRAFRAACFHVRRMAVDPVACRLCRFVAGDAPQCHARLY